MMTSKDMSKKTHTLTFDNATYKLPNRDAAWAFMNACDKAGIGAGFPSLSSPVPSEPDARTVSVSIPTNHVREAADKLANGAEVIEYHFAGSEVSYS